jgi:flagellar protein FlbD
VSQPSRQGVYSAVAGAFLKFLICELRFAISMEGKSQIADRKSQMITLTRLNGQPFVVNAEKIRYLEQTPDTLVCCDNGEKLMVKEPLAEVIRRAIEYARLIRKPVTE